MFVVEGIGGWLVPINRTETMADVVARPRAAGDSGGGQCVSVA